MANYTFKVSVKEIDRALKIVDQFRVDFERRQDLFLARMVQRGIEIVREELQLLIYDTPGLWTGDLRDSIRGGYDLKAKRGWVGTTLYYAKFVEFGTGMVGRKSPHPEYGEQGWVYKPEDRYWIYFNERSQRFVATYGYRARPFMWNAARRLEEEAVTIAKELFG